MPRKGMQEGRGPSVDDVLTVMRHMEGEFGMSVVYGVTPLNGFQLLVMCDLIEVVNEGHDRLASFEETVPRDEQNLAAVFYRLAYRSNLKASDIAWSRKLATEDDLPF